MTNEDIVRMSRQAGTTIYHADWEEIVEFVKLISIAAVKENSAEYRLGWIDGQINEREACAQLCEWYEDFATNDMNYHATLIRERGRSESPQPKVP